MLPFPIRAGRVAGRALRAGLTALAALLLTTCTDNPISPGRGGVAALRVQPLFSASARLVPLALDRVHIAIVRPPSDTIERANRNISAGTNQVNVDIQVDLEQQSESLIVVLEMFSGTTLLFRGVDTLVARSGSGSNNASVPLTYQGPGANIAALTITPRDTTVFLGATFGFTATGADGQQAPVPDFYLGWRASAGTISANGSFTAPTQRDTVVIRGVAPNATDSVEDSTRVFVVAGPGALTVSGGNGQTAVASTRLAAPLAALVTGTDGLPLAGVQVNWAATSGGGSVDSAVTTTDANGIARTGATLGSTIGQQSFTASSAGLTDLIFTATATSPGGNLTWVGTTSTNWSTAANWSPATVPTNTSDVVIPSGTLNSPQITTSCSARTLTVNSGATLALGTINCGVEGNVFADGTISGTGAVAIATTAQIRGNFPSLILSGGITVVGTVNASGNLTLTGGSSLFTVNGQSVGVGGNLQTQGGARLVMTNPGDVVAVVGNASFGGGGEFGSLSAGTLSVGGNFTQIGNAGADPESFHASGTHQTILTGASPTIQFGTAGDVPGTSHFQGFSWTGSGTLTLGSDVYSHGSFTTTSATPVTISSAAGRFLQIGFHTGTAHVTFSNVRLGLREESGGSTLTLNDVTFSGLASTVTQLTVLHTGTGGPFTFNNLTFSVTPTGAGLYLSATDADGGSPLTINVTNSSPASGGSFVATSGGAVVNWPPTVPAPNWDGSASGDWQDPANWTTNQVPTATDDVTIPAGTLNAPSLTTNAAVRSLTINNGAFLTLNGFTLQANGNVFADGGMASGGTVQMAAAGQVRGTFPALTVNAAVTAVGGTFVVGNLTISGPGANYTAGGFATAVSGNLATASSGTLTMSNINDLVDVIGNASFGGGSTTGLLTQGALVVEGSFTQLGAPTTFAASGNHMTHLVYVGTGPAPTVTFGDPVNSRFQNLDVSGSATLQVASNITVLGVLTSVPAGAPDTLVGTAPTLAITAGTVSVTGLVLDNLPLVMSGPGPLQVFNNVTFRNQNPAGTQLTINSNGSGGAYSLSNLVFQTTPTTGGFYLRANDLDGPASGPLTLNVSGSTPTSGSPFTQVVNGAVINWPFIVAPQWDGSQGNSQWGDPANWSTNQVPTATDSVVIPNVANQPVLSANTTVGAVNVSGGDIGLNGFELTVNRTFATTGIGTLTMTGLNDRLTVLGNAVFAGAAGGVMNAGVLTVGGTFTQQNTTSAASFAADPSHVTVLTAISPVISFATPGPSPTGSHFGTLSTNYGAQVFLGSSMTLTGTLTGGDGFGGIIHGPCNAVVTIQQLSGGGTFDCVQLVLDDPTGNPGFLSSVQMINQSSDVDQITVRNPGNATAYTFSNISWTAIASGTGSYINADDTDNAAPLLVIDVLSTNPGNGPVFTKLDGFATVNWPAAGGIIWVGNTDTDWNNPANWSGGAVPIATDNVSIPAGATNEPTITVPAVANDLTVAAGATLTISNAALTLGGNLAAPGQVNPVGSGGINLAGAFKSLSGNVGFLSLQAGSNYFLTGLTSATTVQVVGGALGINNNTMIVSGDFSTSGAGILGMTGAGDLLAVTGNVTFAGGSTAGQLTDGQLYVGGNFAQLNTNSPASYAPTGNHSLLFNGTVPQTVSLAGNGAGSQLSNVLLAGAGMVAQTNLLVNGTLSAGAGAVQPNGHTITVSGSFVTSSAGTLAMSSTLDTLVVAGSATFAGASTQGLLTNGAIRVGGFFQQLASPDPLSFASTGTTVIFDGSGLQNVSFQTPAPTASRFFHVGIANTFVGGGIALNSDVYVLGQIAIDPAVSRVLHGNGGTLHLANLNITDAAGTTFDNVLLDWDVGYGGAFVGLSNVAFQNYSPNATVIRFRHPGVGAAAVNFTNVRFLTSITGGAGTGFYVSAIDSDATGPFLGITVTSNGFPGPTEGGAHVQLTGGATVSFQN